MKLSYRILADSVFSMEPREFLQTCEKVIPTGVMSLTKGEWIEICEALQLPTVGSVAELMASVYTEKKALC